MKAYITVGISASGKSTFAEDLCKHSTLVEINRDNARIGLVEMSGKEFSWKDWDWKHEQDVTKACNDNIKECANSRHSIIISDTNLNTGRRNALIKTLEDLGYEISIKEFPIELYEAIKRDSRRDNPVGESVIKKQYSHWLEYLKTK